MTNQLQTQNLQNQISQLDNLILKQNCLFLSIKKKHQTKRLNVDSEIQFIETEIDFRNEQMKNLMERNQNLISTLNTKKEFLTEDNKQINEISKSIINLKQETIREPKTPKKEKMQLLTKSVSATKIKRAKYLQQQIDTIKQKKETESKEVKRLQKKLEKSKQSATNYRLNHDKMMQTFETQKNSAIERTKELTQLIKDLRSKTRDQNQNQNLDPNAKVIDQQIAETKKTLQQLQMKLVRKQEKYKSIENEYELITKENQKIQDSLKNYHKDHIWLGDVGVYQKSIEEESKKIATEIVTQKSSFGSLNEEIKKWENLLQQDRIDFPSQIEEKEQEQDKKDLSKLLYYGVPAAIASVLILKYQNFFSFKFNFK
ncbi:hypothetical protein M0811_14397 [Anaeramoeba ignava]|uniref:Uncharacterized protein n=1 Tax=Anaeramoeba ignava TaxID=1746090 RepID=A0A9Q0RH92_ANAIG|nr:hypothetical protein M0811_14397 [Anaeramoeba ignava]